MTPPRPERICAGAETDREAELLAGRLETLEDAAFARLMREGWTE